MRLRAEEDVALARVARKGDSRALELLTARMSCLPGLVRSMNKRLGGPLKDEELDEVLQDVLTSLWEKLGQYDGRSALESWAHGFCGTQLLKFLERKRRRARVVYGHEADQAASETAGNNTDLARLEFEWVHAALGRLGPPAEDVVRLRHFEELTFDEIGARLSISPNTAKAQYYRGMGRLREALSPKWRAEQEESV